jgi:transposase
VPVCPAMRACACGRPGSGRPRRYPSDATDAEWALIAPLLPVPACQTGAGGRPEMHCRRAVVDAIRYVVHNGCVWRALPADFPPWRTVYGFYQRWNATGVTVALHDGLRAAARKAAGRKAEPAAAVIDSQSVRAAATVPTASRGWDNAKKVNGRKRHIAVDTSGCCWKSWSPRPAPRTVTLPGRCCSTCTRPAAVSAWPGPTAATPAGCCPGPPPTSNSPSRSSNGPMTCTPSPSCPAAGWSSAPWPGSPPTAAAPATTNASPPTTKPSSTGP